MTGARLVKGGALIDRTRPLKFRFDGRELQGFRGDTLASALIANDIAVVSRSFKRRRPRGVVGAGFAETNAVVQLGAGARLTPNALATLVPLSEGLTAAPSKGWPSVNFDLGAGFDLFSGLFSAGFYYKTFMWPDWALFEPFIRRAAGIGKAPLLADPDRYDAVRRNVDVLVIGAGLAGREAARAAAELGASVLLVDARHALEQPPPEGVELKVRTTALGYYDHGFVTLVEELDRDDLRQRLWKVRAHQVVIATGAVERPLLFAHNDRPGVMLASAVLDYLTLYSVAPGQAAVVATVGDSAYQTAFAAQDAGVDVRAIVDSRPNSSMADCARARGLTVLTQSHVEAAIGSPRLGGVRLGGAASGRRLDCDLLAMSGGWSPQLQLFSQSGGVTAFSQGTAMFQPVFAVQASHVCGAAAGVLDEESVVSDARATGQRAARGQAPQFSPLKSAPMKGADPALPSNPKQVFVDFQTDVSLADLDLAVRENYVAADLAKRYTVLGMGVDQGRLSAANGAEVLAKLQGLDPARVSPTRPRPPFAPVAIAALAAGHPQGGLFSPVRHLPAHGWHVARGAAFEEHLYWRPTHYPQAGETIEAAAAREALAVRSWAGLMDSSSLGKLEFKGPGAGAFLDFVCATRPSAIPIGRTRYFLMCDELGALLDDGVVLRLGPDHFLMNTSSGHLDRVRNWIDDWRQRLGRRDFVMVDVTEDAAVLTLAGPMAREILVKAGWDGPLSSESFPHLSWREGRLGGFEARINRVSFTGEASFEISVASDEAQAFAGHLWQIGAPFGLVPFGLDALDILRIEKGYLHVGGDTDSTTTPADVGFPRLASRPGDFIGRRSLNLPGQTQSAQATGRRQLVALGSTSVLPIGAHLIENGARKSVGFVTSSAFSPTLDRPVALALLENGRQRLGDRLSAWSEGEAHAVQVSPLVSFDPEGGRLHG